MIVIPPNELAVLNSQKSASTLDILQPPPVHPTRHFKGTPSTPPGYAETRRPTTTLTYSFYPQTIPANSMILTLPAYVPEPQPPYYISVNMNCFTPSSYITVIRRGAWEGEVIGDFEMGMSKKPGSMFIHGTEHPLNEMLESSTRLFRTTWSWKVINQIKSTNLFWDDSQGAGVLTCFSSKDRTVTNLLAKFIPPTHPRRLGRQQEMTRLEVTPLGHEYMDDIVMSSLIIERIRTTPSVWQLSI